MNKQIRLRTNWIKARFPNPRPQCPVCGTLRRIQNGDWPARILLRSGSLRGSCDICKTIYGLEVGPGGMKKHRYVAQSLNRTVKVKLANYWIATHKGPIPKMLRIDEEEIN